MSDQSTQTTRSSPRAVAPLEVDVEVAGQNRKAFLVSRDIGVGGIPEFFRSKQWHHFPDGVPTPEFLDRAQTLVRELRMRKAGVR